MRAILCSGLFLLLFSCAFGQHGLRLQNSYFLSGQPLFGLGYEHYSSTPWTYGVGFEFGRYAYHEQDLINATMEEYSIHGFAVVPEARYYLGAQAKEGIHQGVFTLAFAHLRKMNEYSVDNPGTSAYVRKGASLGGGLGIGYRTACGDFPLFVEILAGFGKAHAFWQNQATDSDARARAGSFDSSSLVYRLELAVGYRF